MRLHSLKNSRNLTGNIKDITEYESVVQAIKVHNKSVKLSIST